MTRLLVLFLLIERLQLNKYYENNPPINWLTYNGNGLQ
jgi:hypothetical protein